ncbi:MAG: hypothetical protein PVH02_03575 [Desulfobacteraceae bacterium]|jgi:hypothetical protein
MELKISNDGFLNCPVCDHMGLKVPPNVVRIEEDDVLIPVECFEGHSWILRVNAVNETLSMEAVSKKEVTMKLDEILEKEPILRRVLDLAKLAGQEKNGSNKYYTLFKRLIYPKVGFGRQAEYRDRIMHPKTDPHPELQTTEAYEIVIRTIIEILDGDATVGLAA